MRFEKLPRSCRIVLACVHLCPIRKAGKPKLVEKWGKKMQKAGAVCGAGLRVCGVGSQPKSLSDSVCVSPKQWSVEFGGLLTSKTLQFGLVGASAGCFHEKNLDTLFP